MTTFVCIAGRFTSRRFTGTVRTARRRKTMPAIKKTLPSETYRNLVQSSNAFGEKNDCTVRALVVLTGRSYKDCLNAMESAGRKKGKGAYVPQVQEAADLLGHPIRELSYMEKRAIIESYPERDHCLQGITTHHARRFRKAWANQPPMLLFVNGHVAAFRDGVVHDWAVNKALRVLQIFVLA
jgi:hypothetical protein